MTHEEFDRQAEALRNVLVDAIHDEIHEQTELELSVINAALFDTVCFYAAMAPAKVRRSLMRQFRERLIETLEAGIEDHAEKFDETLPPYMTVGGHA
jgi:hypothetical protein